MKEREIKVSQFISEEILIIDMQRGKIQEDFQSSASK